MCVHVPIAPDWLHQTAYARLLPLIACIFVFIISSETTFNSQPVCLMEAID